MTRLSEKTQPQADDKMPSSAFLARAANKDVLIHQNGAKPAVISNISILDEDGTILCREYARVIDERIPLETKGPLPIKRNLVRTDTAYLSLHSCPYPGYGLFLNRDFAGLCSPKIEKNEDCTFTLTWIAQNPPMVFSRKIPIFENECSLLQASTHAPMQALHQAIVCKDMLKFNRSCKKLRSTLKKLMAVQDQAEKYTVADFIRDNPVYQTYKNTNCTYNAHT